MKIIGPVHLRFRQQRPTAQGAWYYRTDQRSIPVLLWVVPSENLVAPMIPQAIGSEFRRTLDQLDGEWAPVHLELETARGPDAVQNLPGKGGRYAVEAL